MKYNKKNYKEYFTENRGNKMKRCTKEFFSWVGTFIFGVFLVAGFYVLYLCAYACM